MKMRSSRKSVGCNWIGKLGGGYLVEKVENDKNFITLGQMLKYENIIENGGQAKFFLSEYLVYVNGEEELRRGRKLYVGDVVKIPGFGEFEIGSEEW